MVVRHGGREEDRRPVRADTSDVAALERRVISWLEDRRWDRSRWGEFRTTFYSEGRPVEIEVSG